MLMKMYSVTPLIAEQVLYFVQNSSGLLSCLSCCLRDGEGPKKDLI